MPNSTWMFLALALTAQQGPPPPADADSSLSIPVLRNGNFAEPANPALGPLPWWRVIAGSPRVEGADDGAALVTGTGDIVQQPLPAMAGATGDFVIRGRLRGIGTLTLIDGLGGSASESWRGDSESGFEFEVRGSDLASGLMRVVEPRFVLQLTGGESLVAEGEARWSELTVEAPFPCPSEADLRAEILALLSWSFDRQLSLSLDDLGPRPTAFVAHEIDVDTGEPVGAPMGRVTYHPLYGQLLRAWVAEPRDDWRVALERYVRDFLELGLHPETGLPRYWDPVADVPLDDAGMEIRVHMDFLLDLADHGPPSVRADCLAAAERIGEHVLSAGVLPDGSVAARYVPGDGRPTGGTVAIRRLDVPSVLARLGGLLGDERYRDVAREAVLELSYDHYWPGTWDRIDPGFDDNYGHYGERALVMWEAWPDEPAFRQMALSGFDHYAPLWRDALRYGGNIAADQVRCWRIAAGIAELSPDRAELVNELLAAAVDVHFAGQQTNGGPWIDVTVVNFDPQRLPVGDTAGVPQNLLEGLGLVYDHELGQRSEVTRAAFTGVVRQTVASFGGAHGLIGTTRRASAETGNRARGSLRLHPGLLAMLEQLD